MQSTSNLVSDVGKSIYEFAKSLDDKLGNGGSGNSHTSDSYSGDDSKVRQGGVENDINIDAFILPYLRTNPTSNSAQEFMQGVEIGTSIFDIVSKILNTESGTNKNDTIFSNYKVTTNDIGGFNHSYIMIVGEKDTTEVRRSTNRNEIQRAAQSYEKDNEKK